MDKERVQTVLYRNNQLAPIVIEAHNSIYKPSIRLVVNGKSTNYLGITVDELEAIKKLLTTI